MSEGVRGERNELLGEREKQGRKKGKIEINCGGGGRVQKFPRTGGNQTFRRLKGRGSPGRRRRRSTIAREKPTAS